MALANLLLDRGDRPWPWADQAEVAGENVEELRQLVEVARLQQPSARPSQVVTVGRFGYRLVAATGRSGHTKPAGGVVYTIDAGGSVRRVGSYAGPGGADEVAIAPAGFGSVAGWALLTVDPGASGTIVAIDPRGRTRTIASLPDGPNPIAVAARGRGGAAAAAGFYVADTNTKNVYFASAAQLARYTGDVLVGTELGARFFSIRPRGQGFQTRELKTDLPPAKYNLEGGDYVS